MLRALRTQILFSSWKNVTRNNQVRYGATGLAFKGRASFEPLEGLYGKALNQNAFIVEKIVTRTGRLPEKQLSFLSGANNEKVKYSSHEILILINCCGELAFAEDPKVRIDTVKKIWSYMKNKGLKPDVSHYNALLKVYLNCEYEFSPSEILAEMEKDNVTPNRLTFTHIITTYCQKGDLSGTSGALGDMKKHSIPLNENIFHALIYGHCLAKDVIGAENVMKIMKEKNLPITSFTYAAFLSGLAICGDENKFDTVYKQSIEENIKFRKDQLSNIIYYLALGGLNSRAVEIFEKNGEIMLINVHLLLNRLLHKKLYDVWFSIVHKYREKMTYSLFEPEYNLFRNLGEAETVENIKKLAHAWEEKGYCKDTLTSILYYTLRKNLEDKSLELLQELQKTGQPIKEIYFWPMVVNAVKEKNIQKILNLVRIMRNDFGIRISKLFLTNIIFNNSNMPERADHFLMYGLRRIGISRASILEAYITSCIRAKKTKVLIKLTDIATVNQVFSIGKCLALDSDLTDPIDFVNLMKNLLTSAVNRRDTLPMRLENEEPGEFPLDTEKNDIGYLGQDVLDNFTLGMASSMTSDRKNVLLDTLKEMVKEGLSISEKAGNNIKEIWNDQEISVVIDELTRGNLDVSKYIRNDEVLPRWSEENRQYLDEFSKICKQNMVDEAEKFLKDHPNLINDVIIPFMVLLKRNSNEEKFTEFLKNFSSEINASDLPIRVYIFLQAELIRKGLIKEVCHLIEITEMRNTEKVVFLELLKPLFQKGSLEEINMIINAGVGKACAVNLNDVVEFYRKRFDWENILKLLEYYEYKSVKDVISSKELGMELITNGDIEFVKRFIDLMERKIPRGEFSLYLVIAYAWVGDIVHGRKYLDEVNIRNTANVFIPNRVSSMKERIQLGENLINMLMGDHRFYKVFLYEELMEAYDIDNCDPSKGLALWEQIQEENIVPSVIFYMRLERLLKRNNLDIPFEENTVKFPDWLLSLNVPRPLLRILISEYIKDNLKNVERILIECTAMGNLGIPVLQKLKDFAEEHENSNTLKKMIKHCLNLAEWREALLQGNLSEYATQCGKFSNTNPKLNALPESYLCKCLMTESSNEVSSDVARIILWAYMYVCNDKIMFDVYEKHVKNIIQNSKILGRVLEVIPHLRANLQIIKFLMSRKVFEDQGMKNEANFVLQSVIASDGRRQFRRYRKFSLQYSRPRADIAAQEISSSSESSETPFAMVEEKREEIPRDTMSM